MTREFTKYRERGAYHWGEASRHPIHGWPYTRSRVEWVVRQCARSGTVLEIGCGDAALLARLARQGMVVTGIDSDEGALRLAREMFARHGLHGVFHSDLIAIKKATFDAVILAEVLEHVNDAEGLLAEIVARLSDHGRLVLTTPIRLLEHPLDPHHVHEFWPGELATLLDRYFEDVRLVRLHPAWIVDLLCVGVGGIRPLAVLANLVRLLTGIELIDTVRSPLSLFWTQAAVATRPRRERVH